MKKSLIATLALGLAVFTAPAAGFTFTPGNIYMSVGSSIREVSATGQLISTKVLSTEPRGLAFGPDGYLYVARLGAGFTGTPSVDVLREDGSVVRTYSLTGSIWSYAAGGKLCFDRSGENFYVSTSNGVYKFAVAGVGGSPITSTSAHDLTVLPNGDLLVANAYELNRHDPSGVLLNTIGRLSNPLHLGGAGDSIRLGDVSVVEYDAHANRTLVTMLGYSGMGHKVFELVGESDVLARMESYNYASDIFVTDTGRTLIGSTTQPPGVFNASLQYLGQFGSVTASFITALPEHLFADGLELP